MSTQQYTDWSDDIKFNEDLMIKASSYNPQPVLWETKPVDHNRRLAVSTWTKYETMISPSGRWRYVRQTLLKDRKLSIYYSNKRGSVRFDDTVFIPVLIESPYPNQPAINPTVWMSLTPMEILTLRGGVRRAKGDCIIAGLGMGWQLAKIACRKQVKSITLVEREQELVDWILPVVKAKCPEIETKLKTIVVGNAYKVIPDLSHKQSFDSCIVDIFDSYGGNSYNLRQIERDCKGDNIKSFWAWGTSELYDNSYLMPSFF